MLEQAEVLVRILVAAALAGTIGFERESAGKSAGLRTHMLVGMSAALFVGLGELAVTTFPLQEFEGGEIGLRYDPIRVLQAIVIGIGFMGSGIIFVDRDRTRTLGLTTAASVWATAGVGIAAGLGLYVTAMGTTVMLFLVLKLFTRMDRGGDG